MVVFEILEFFCLISAILTCGLGSFVFAKNSASPVNRLFMAATLGATFWGIGEFLIWLSGSYDGAWFWLKASAFWPFVIVLAVHFSFAFTDHPVARPENRHRLGILLYIPALAVTLLGLFTDLIYRVVFIPGIGYSYVPVLTSPVYLTETAYFTLAVFCAGYVSLTMWRSAESRNIRGQSGFVCLGIVTVLVFGALSAFILPALGIVTPNMVFIGIVLFSLVIAYAVNRYGLFILSPETAVTEILRLMPDGLLLAGRDGRVIAINPAAAEILRIPPGELPGRLVFSLFPGPVADSIGNELRDHGVFTDLEVIVPHRENTVVSIAGSLVKDPHGEPAGSVLILRDITGRKTAERALQRAHEQISLLNQLTRHDIVNLLTGLSGYLLILQEQDLGAENASYADASMGLVDKIHRQLRFSRDYQQIGEHQPAWRELAPMICEAIDDLPHANIGISSTVAPVAIYADMLTVKVFYNLFENAVRHGGHVSEIRVRTTEQADGSLLITVEDDGQGIPEAEKEAIFGYGFGNHTGLGLALSRDILALTGIRLSESGTPGSGARFEILVPRSSWRQT